MTPKSLPTRALIASLAIAPALACGIDSAEPESIDSIDELEHAPTVEELRADSEYMREVFEDHDETRAMPIDLGDDLQYRFLVNRLRAAGLSRVTAPEVFERVDHARRAAADGLTFRTGSEACDMFITPDDAPEGTLGTIGRSSCVDGSDYSLLQVCHYDQLGNLLDCSVEEEFGDGIDTDVVTHTIIEQGFADGVSYHLNSVGEEFYYYATALTTTASGLRLSMAHPQDLTSNGNVEVCLERSTDSTDCDYKHSVSGVCAGNSLCNYANQPLFPVFNPGQTGAAAGQYNGDRLYMPLQSTGTYLVPVGSQINSARAWLTLKSTGDTTPAGGLCTADFTGSPYLSFHPFSGSFQKMVISPFALDIGNALWPDHCVDHRTAVDLHVEVNLQTGASQRTYAWKSSQDYTSMSIAWGCLPPGTTITLADGTEVAIEEVEPGDQVMADDDGGVLTVTNVMEGHEDEPLVVVEDSLGHRIPMTATHPVPTVDRGALQARELVLGDRLETEDGIAHVVGIEREDYDGEVFNLVLGTPAELEARGEDTTMMANHVRVGDVHMQGALKVERSASADAERAQAPLPPSLYVDYVGAQLRGLVRSLEG